MSTEDTLTIRPMRRRPLPRWLQNAGIAPVSCLFCGVTLAPDLLPTPAVLASVVVVFLGPLLLFNWMASRPISVDATSIRQPGIRIPRDGAAVEVFAWTDLVGRIGTVVAITRGRRCMRLATRGVFLDTARGSWETDLEIGNVDFARLLARLAPDQPLRSERGDVERSRVWCSPRWRIPPYVGTALTVTGVIAMQTGLNVAWLRVPTVATVLVGMLLFTRFRRSAFRENALRVENRTVALETDGETTWQTTAESPTRLVVVAVGHSTIELTPPGAARPFVVANRTDPKADLCVSPEDFGWLGAALGLTTQ